MNENGLGRDKRKKESFLRVSEFNRLRAKVSGVILAAFREKKKNINFPQANH